MLEILGNDLSLGSYEIPKQGDGEGAPFESLQRVATVEMAWGLRRMSSTLKTEDVVMKRMLMEPLPPEEDARIVPHILQLGYFLLRGPG